MGLGSSRSRGNTEDDEDAEVSSNPLAQGYENLVNAIIRPPRMEYSATADLGPSSFAICGKQFERKDLELQNKAGQKVVCSWWKFKAEDAPAKELPCVIYLHGNASCRIAAFELLRHLLPLSITVFALDFAGSGNSGGEYVSLGYFEQVDVEAAITHLRGSGEVSTIGLWGHSMGAATALLYADRDPSIAGMVVDSSFADLNQLINELGNNMREQGLRVPGFAITAAVGLIRRSVRKRANFDPKDVVPIANGDKAFIPALFAHGKDDAFIRPSHTEQLHNNYAGDKELVLFDGDHNSSRPDFLFTRAVTFLYQRLGVKDEHVLLNGSSPNHGGGSPFDVSGGTAAVRHAEETMMRQAMMMSLHDAYGASAGAAASPARGGAGGEAASPASGGFSPPRRLGSRAIPPEELKRGAEQFQAVTGQGGATAQYYVEVALSYSGTVEQAIQRYFDCDCAPAPDDYRPSAPQPLAL